MDNITINYSTIELIHRLDDITDELEEISSIIDSDDYNVDTENIDEAITILMQYCHRLYILMVQETINELGSNSNAKHN